MIDFTTVVIPLNEGNEPQFLLSDETLEKYRCFLTEGYKKMKSVLAGVKQKITDLLNEAARLEQEAQANDEKAAKSSQLQQEICRRQATLLRSKSTEAKLLITRMEDRFLCAVQRTEGRRLLMDRMITKPYCLLQDNSSSLLAFPTLEKWAETQSREWEKKKIIQEGITVVSTSLPTKLDPQKTLDAEHNVHLNGWDKTERRVVELNGKYYLYQLTTKAIVEETDSGISNSLATYKLRGYQPQTVDWVTDSLAQATEAELAAMIEHEAQHSSCQ